MPWKGNFVQYQVPKGINQNVIFDSMGTRQASTFLHAVPGL